MLRTGLERREVQRRNELKIDSWSAIGLRNRRGSYSVGDSLLTEILELIGDLGGGKSTLAQFLSLVIKQEHPEAVQVTNVSMDTAHKVADVNKFIALKLIKKNKQYVFCTEDEASQAGLEARGSGGKDSALETRAITLARKAHVDLVLITQLLSMIDKRAQWLGTLYILCEAKFLPDNPTVYPDYFEYTLFDSKLREIGSFELDFIDCVEHIFPHMDTDDIPVFEHLKELWEQWYEIKDSDYIEFDWIMKGSPVNKRAAAKARKKLEILD